MLQRIRARVYREVTDNLTYTLTDWVAEKIRISRDVPVGLAKK